tara:strand:+ start:295 stop:564 length:270 start_codon:yes stop_codon:yes gene_type:complete
MNLYRVTAANFKDFFGDTIMEQATSHREMINFAQKPDCSAFLFLSDQTYDNDSAELLDEVPSGYDFTYCQEWGLDVNQSVLDRVIEELS